MDFPVNESHTFQRLESVRPKKYRNRYLGTIKRRDLRSEGSERLLPVLGFVLRGSWCSHVNLVTGCTEFPLTFGVVSSSRTLKVGSKGCKYL